MTNREQSGSIAQSDPGGCRYDSSSERGERCLGVSRCFLRCSETFAIGRVRRISRNSLGEARDAIRRALEFKHQHAEQCLGHGIVVIENYGFRCIRCCPFPVIHLHADIGPALAQAGMFRPLLHGRVQLCLCQIQPAFTPSQTCGDFRELRRWRSKQAHGRQQWPSSRRASSIDQRGEARLQYLGINRGLQLLHVGSF